MGVHVDLWIPKRSAGIFGANNARQKDEKGGERAQTSHLEDAEATVEANPVILVPIARELRESLVWGMQRWGVLV